VNPGQNLFATKQIVIGTYRGAGRHDHECIVRTATE
jgi:hypothetical protein